MTAANLALVIEQWADFTRTLTIRDKSKQPVDLTGCTARMQIRPEPGSATLYHELSTESGGIALVDPAAGTVRLFIPAETTGTFTWCRAVYDLLLIDTGGRPRRLIEGAVSVDAGVTR